MVFSAARTFSFGNTLENRNQLSHWTMYVCGKGRQLYLIIQIAISQVPMATQLVGHNRFLRTASRIKFIIRFVPKFFLKRFLSFFQNIIVSRTIVRFVQQFSHCSHTMKCGQPQSATIGAWSVHEPRVERLIRRSTILNQAIVVFVPSQCLVHHRFACRIHRLHVSQSVH